MTLVACTGKNITGKFYTDHREQIDTIKTLLKNSTDKSHSHSRFDKRFRTVTLDIQTDSMTYIYDFLVTDPRLTDTLQHYQLDTAVTKGRSPDAIHQMYLGQQFGVLCRRDLEITHFYFC